MNIDRMLSKLDQSYGSYYGDPQKIDHSILREVLLAGKEPAPKELKIGGYQELALRIAEMNKRIGCIEENCGCKVKWKEEMEKRVSKAFDKISRYDLPSRMNDVEKRVADIEQVLRNVPRDEKAWVPAYRTCAHLRTCYATDGQLWCEDCHKLLGQPDNKKDDPAVSDKYCQKCGEYKHDCICEPEPKEECTHTKADGFSGRDWYCHKSFAYYSGDTCPWCKPSTPNGNTEGQGLEAKVTQYLSDHACLTKFGGMKYKDMAIEIIELVRSHSLPKDKILVDRKLAQNWYDRNGRTTGCQDFSINVHKALEAK